MSITYILISDNKISPNWTGLEFSNTPARGYIDIFHLLSNLEKWFAEIREPKYMGKISIISLSNNELADKLKSNQVFL